MSSPGSRPSRRALLAGAAVTALTLAGLVGRPTRGPAHDGHDAATTPGATPAGTPAGTPGATPIAGHTDPHDRVTGTGVGGLYLTIVNAGPAPDALLGGATDVCRAVEPHTMRDDGGVMVMDPAPDGLPVEAGATVTLGPSADHLMLTDLTRDLLPGAGFVATLRFAGAGEVVVTVPIAWDPPAALAPPVTVGALTVSAVWSRPAPMIGP